MNTFDRRWQRLTAAAREAPSLSEAAPHGWAARVWARAQPGRGADAGGLWLRWALRALGAMASLLVIATVLDRGLDRHDATLRPPLENVIAGIFWSL
ncbi:MAG TPA: hypothetical protein PKM73_03650 [Verrucomicrobiota bacterium]|nr:hypothetical protein [Verrucomicrobiota bacterium]HNU50844.1 hypothetical protein [Verrucomicrobiota bacterium]